MIPTSNMIGRLHLATLLCASPLAVPAPAASAARQATSELERAAQEVSLPEPAIGDLGLWLDLVRPVPDELAWEAIPWIPTFAGGVLAARAAGKPLLFWAMNGHPLGCT